jgi:hypothetical protein
MKWSRSTRAEMEEHPGETLPRAGILLPQRGQLPTTGSCLTYAALGYDRHTTSRRWPRAPPRVVRVARNELGGRATAAPSGPSCRRP